MSWQEARFVLGFGLFHGWLITLITYTAAPPLGGGGPLPSTLFVLGGGMASALAFIVATPPRLALLRHAGDWLLVLAVCLVFTVHLAPSPAIALACCLTCGLLCGMLHCLYGLASLAFPKREFARIIALATVVASLIAIGASVIAKSESTIGQAVALAALPLSAAFILKSTPSAPASRENVPQRQLNERPERLETRFARLLLAVLLFGIVCRTCDVFSTARFTGLVASSIAMFAGHIVAAGLLIVLPHLMRRRDGLALLYRFALPCAGAGFIILAFPGTAVLATSLGAVFLIGAGFEVINLVAWVLTSFAAQISARPSRYFGLYALITYLAMLAGRLVNLAILPYAAAHTAFLGLICIVALVVVALVILPEDQVILFEESLRLSEEEKAAGDARWARCLVFANAHGLTERETEVLDLLVRGRTLKVVAERLTISKGTAGTHIANIYRKCDVHAQQDLIDQFEEFSSQGRP